MAELNEIARELALLERGEAGHVSVGMSPTPAAILAKPLMLHMASRPRGPTLTLSTGESTALVAALRAERHDLVIIDANVLVDAQGLQIDALPSLQGDFMCRAGHPLLRRGGPTFDEVRAYPVACSPISQAAAVELVRMFGPEGHPDRLVTLTSHDYGALRDIALQSDLVVMGMTTTYRADIEAGRLVALGLVSVRDVGRYAVARLACRRPTSAMETIREIAVQNFLAWH